MKHSNKTMFAALFGVSLLLTTGCFGGSDTTSPSAPTKSTTTPTQTQTPPAPTTTPSSGNTGGSSTGTGTTTTTTTTTSSGGGTQAPASAFPGVVQDGMNQFTANPPMKLYAPTFVPQAKSGWQAVSARTWSTGDDYNVQILQTQTPMPVNQADMRYVQILGSFSGKSYASASEALQNIDGITGYMNLSDPNHNGSSGSLTTGTVDLGTGITGKTYVFKSSNPSAKTLNQYAGIEWQEGRWNIQVTTTASTTLPVQVAEQVVQYLHKYLLPAPQTKGDVAVQVGVDGAIDEIVTLQQGANVYMTQTTSYAANSAIAALEMAVSMQEYK